MAKWTVEFTEVVNYVVEVESPARPTEDTYFDLVDVQVPDFANTCGAVGERDLVEVRSES